MTDNPWHELMDEKRRTEFNFYGFTMADGSAPTAPYFKLAYSLQMALDDLRANPGVRTLDYRVVDVVVTEEDSDYVLHVELRAGDDDEIGDDDETA